MWKEISLNNNEPDKYFSTIFGEIVSNINIEQSVIPVGQKFKQLHDFYDFPLPSSSIGIYKIAEKERRCQYWKLSHVKAKCIAIPLVDGILCISVINF